MDQTQKVEILRQHQSTKGLDEEQLLHLASLTIEQEYVSGEIIFNEGTYSSSIYYIVEGRVTLLKWDEERKHQFKIGSLHSGDTFGDMSFIDNSPRSTTIKATKNTKLLVIDSKKLSDQTNLEKQIFQQMAANLAILNITRLRTTNDNYVRTLRSELELTKIKNEFGKFFVLMVILIGISTIIDRLLELNFYGGLSNILLNWGYLGVLLVPPIIFILHFKYPITVFGVTKVGLKKSILEALFICFFLSILCILLVISSSQPNHSQFLSAFTNHDYHRLLHLWIIGYLPNSYLQEFIARGVVQTSLQKFISDRGLLSVTLVSILFTTTHAYGNLLLVVLTFAVSMFLGLIYNRERNLVGVSIIHFFLGAAGIFFGFM